MNLQKLSLTAILAFCILFCLVGGTCVAFAEEDANVIRYEGPGYASGEEAVAAYIEAAKHLDTDGMVRAFAIESAADGCDTLGIIKKQGFWDSNMTANLIANDTFIDRYRALSRLRTVTNTIMWEFMVLNNPEGELRSNFVLNVRRDGDAAIEAAKETIDVSSLAELLPAIDHVRFYTRETSYEKSRGQRIKICFLPKRKEA